MVISAAAGAVGSIAGQIAKQKGAHVIGIAGGPDKCRWLTEELGFDAAIDYKNEDVGEALDRLAPNGVDLEFRERRRRHHGRGLEPAEHPRPHGRLRHGLGLQRHQDARRRRTSAA